MTVRRSTTLHEIYAYPDETWSTMNLAGFSVEATDGGIGKVDETTHEVGSGYLIVDTGPWIFGKKVLLPAGVISRVDQQDERVWLNLTKDEIKNAPEFDESTFRDQDYRDQVGTYYGGRAARTGATDFDTTQSGSTNRPSGPDFGKDDRGF
jgi:hypothetical protein